ncbi:MAG: FKBP-type peptidyl-prolyl cis-trans isomerase [Dysgonamonadaceae bacterium]
MKIETNKYVTLEYDLNVGEGEELELMERATKEKPLEFIYGTNSMLEAFERNIGGLEEGEEFMFTLTPEQGYGEYEDEKIIDLPINIFEIDGKVDNEMLFEGNMLPMMDTMGNQIMGSVVSVSDSVVTMDFNHPLSGEVMHFKGSVLGVREASVEEIAALFTAGGGGCGCGSDECGCGSGDDEVECGCSTGEKECGCGSGGCK